MSASNTLSTGIAAMLVSRRHWPRLNDYDPLIGHQEIKSLLPTRQVPLGSMPRSDLEHTVSRAVGYARAIAVGGNAPLGIRHT